jgi:thioredoxin domain-containing protein 5
MQGGPFFRVFPTTADAAPLFPSWCGWCKRLEPTWNELAGAVSSNVHIGKIECIEQPITCQALKVQGFPTLRLLDNGQMYSFLGGNRELSTLRSFAEGGYKNEKSEPVPALRGGGGGGGEAKLATRLVVEEKPEEHKEPILTEQNFHDRTASGRWLVAATAPWCGHCKSLAPTINKLAAAKDLTFNVASINCDEDANLCRDLGVLSFPTLVLVEQGHFATMPNKAERTFDALKQFADSGYKSIDLRPVRGLQRGVVRRGGLQLLDEATYDEATARGAWLVGFSCSSPACKDMEKALGETQKSYSLHLQVGVVDCELSPALCDENKITTQPTVVLLYLDRGFLFSGEHTSSNYIMFIGDGFKSAKGQDRQHLGIRRRLTFDTLTNGAAWRDFVHQNRYTLVACVGIGLLVWGLFWGSALAYSPTQMMKQQRSRQPQQPQQRQQQAGEYIQQAAPKPAGGEARKRK